jgi:hypothetical protein
MISAIAGSVFDRYDIWRRVGAYGVILFLFLRGLSRPRRGEGRRQPTFDPVPECQSGLEEEKNPKGSSTGSIQRSSDPEEEKSTEGSSNQIPAYGTVPVLSKGINRAQYRIHMMKPCLN